jgi:hypothetical protein
MRYRNTTADVDAETWDGTATAAELVDKYGTSADDIIDTDEIADRWDDEAAAYKLSTGEYVFAPSGERFLILLTVEGRALAAIGDWIIRHPDGSLHVMKPDEFARTYAAL